MTRCVESRIHLIARAALGVCCVLGMLAGCAPVPPSAPKGHGAAAVPAIDDSALKSLSADIRSGKYANIHGLLVLQDGELIWEDYFTGKDERRGQAVGEVRFDAHSLHDARSVTKSIVSALFGVALAEGKIRDIDSPVLDYFPEYADLRTPQRAQIRLRHLLSMTSGIRWDESSRPYGDADNSETAMDRAADPIRYVLEQPIAAEPGVKWEYSGGDTAVLARIIERATGQDLDAYAQRVLFAPLAFEKHEWLRYPNGTAIASSGLRILPRDMAKIGALYLDGGRWRGRQILPPSWVRDSLSPHAKIAERPFGFQNYGYQWWLGTARVGADGVPFAAAVGWGGQRIFVVPSMRAVVVVTAGLYGDPRQTDITFEIVFDRVLPLLRARTVSAASSR